MRDEYHGYSWMGFFPPMGNTWSSQRTTRTAPATGHWPHVPPSQLDVLSGRVLISLSNQALRSFCGSRRPYNRWTRSEVADQTARGGQAVIKPTGFIWKLRRCRSQAVPASKKRDCPINGTFVLRLGKAACPTRKRRGYLPLTLTSLDH